MARSPYPSLHSVGSPESRRLGCCFRKCRDRSHKKKPHARQHPLEPPQATLRALVSAVMIAPPSASIHRLNVYGYDDMPQPGITRTQWTTPPRK